MLKVRGLKNQIKNENGMAIMELIPIMIIIVLLFNFSLGFFGAIHTGILNQMAARNYAFETFRNRSNLSYFREGVAKGDSTYYGEIGLRFHGITTENAKGNKDRFIATARPIDFLANMDTVGTNQFHNNQIYNVKDGKRFTDNSGVNPLWVRPQYGLCLDTKCGD